MFAIVPEAGFSETVERYLDAIDGVPRSVLRRERRDCESLASWLVILDAAQPTRAVIEAWTDSWRTAPRPPSLARRGERLDTLRRLLVLGGGDANLLEWLDAQRGRLIGSPFAARSAQHAAAEQLAREADELLRLGQIEDATATARRAIRLDPACVPAHAVTGRVALERRDMVRALAIFRQALFLSADGRARDLRVGVADVLDGLGQTFIALGCYDEASEVYRRLRLASPDWAAHSDPILGRLALYRRRPQEAVEWLQGLGGLELFGLTLAWLLAGRRERAARTYARALALNPLVPPLLVGRRDDPAFDMLAHRPEQLAEAWAWVEDWEACWDGEPDALVHLDLLWIHAASRRLVMRVANANAPLLEPSLRRAQRALASV